MRLTDLVYRSPQPEPWAEGETIPWNDPGFSQRMLGEHLSQEHDLASRRSVVIDSQVAWIHEVLLGMRPAQVLDLGCGPGLYTSRLASLGHTCTGIDWSPASLQYARETAAREELRITYQLEDLRKAAFPPGQDLVILLYGELNIFRPSDATNLLQKAFGALRAGGRILLEPHTVEGVKQGSGRRSWWAAPSGLFSDRPHLGLEESFWDEQRKAKTTRYYMIDTETHEVTRYAASQQAYTREEYTQLLITIGFVDVDFRDGLSPAYPQDGLQVITAVRPK